MKLNILFLFLCLISNLVKSFRPSGFCKKDNIIDKCIDYDCGKYCSVDKYSCDYLISWGIFMKDYSNKPKAYKRFILDINTCMTKGSIKNQWSHRLHFG